MGMGTIMARMASQTAASLVVGEDIVSVIKMEQRSSYSMKCNAAMLKLHWVYI
jgi:hypothetical protein